MSRRASTRISALLFFIHSVIEIAGSIVLVFNPQIQSGFGVGRVGEQQFEADALIVSVIGLIWGVTRFVAGWGIWHKKKWAIILGILMSVITMTAAISIIPAGVVDTILSAPALILLLYAWFGRETL